MRKSVKSDASVINQFFENLFVNQFFSVTDYRNIVDNHRLNQNTILHIHEKNISFIHTKKEMLHKFMRGKITGAASDEFNVFLHFVLSLHAGKIRQIQKFVILNPSKPMYVLWLAESEKNQWNRFFLFKICYFLQASHAICRVNISRLSDMRPELTPQIPKNFWLHRHYQTDNINDNYQNKLKPVALITVPGSGTMTIEFFISQLNNRNFISIERNHYPSNSELRLIVRDGYNLHYHRMLKKKHIDFIKSAGYIILIATRNIEEIQESRIRHRAEQRSWVPYSFNKKTDRRLDDSRKIIERKFEADMIVDHENLKRDDKSVLSSINRRFFHQNKNFENQVYRAYSEIIGQGGLHYRKKSAN